MMCLLGGRVREEAWRDSRGAEQWSAKLELVSFNKSYLLCMIEKQRPKGSLQMLVHATIHYTFIHPTSYFLSREMHQALC